MDEIREERSCERSAQLVSSNLLGVCHSNRDQKKTPSLLSFLSKRKSRVKEEDTLSLPSRLSFRVRILKSGKKSCLGVDEKIIKNFMIISSKGENINYI